MKALLAEVDVFVVNVRGKAVERLGLDYESVKAINPEIVYCHTSSYGPRGARVDDGAAFHPGGRPSAYGVHLRLRADYPLASLPNEGARVVARAVAAGRCRSAAGQSYSVYHQTVERQRGWRQRCSSVPDARNVSRPSGYRRGQGSWRPPEAARPP